MNSLQYYTPSSSKKLEEIKKSAKSIVEKSEFPTHKNEEWKYTNIKAFNIDEYQKAKSQDSISDNKIKSQIISENLSSYKIIFLDGIFKPELSLLPKGMIVTTLKEALEDNNYSEILKNKFNSFTNNRNIYSDINTTFIEDGLFIDISKNTVEEKAIEILYLNSEQTFKAFQNLRSFIYAGKSSQVNIIEKIYTFSSEEFFTNHISEIFIEENAIFNLYKIQEDINNSILMDNTIVSQKGDSQSFIHTFSFGGKVIRNELSFIQDGKNINSTLKGINILSGKQQIGNHTTVHHNTPNCESHELYRGIYDDESHGIFNGKILVHQLAQKTNAFQQNNSILISDKATIDTKPQLEIFADDVKCSHGCTVGQLDMDALFYLQSRGIPKTEAKALLMLAFTADVLNTVNIPELKDKINKLVAKKLNVEIDF